METCVASFGVSATVTSNRGFPFVLILFCDLPRTFGCEQYHKGMGPSSKRSRRAFPRRLKVVIVPTSSAKWSRRPVVTLLGIRTTIREDLQRTPVELVYCNPTRPPGDKFNETASSNPYPSSFEGLYLPCSNICNQLLFSFHTRSLWVVFLSLSLFFVKTF